jgi:hypothetical protein
MVSHKNYDLNVNEDFGIFWLPSYCILHWWFHFRNEIPINGLFTRWKCTYILDLRPWRWSALNMGFVVKRPSNMQGQCFFQSWAGLTSVFGWVQKNPGRGPKFCGRVAPARIWHPLVRRGDLMSAIVNSHTSLPARPWNLTEMVKGKLRTADWPNMCCRVGETFELN